MESRNKLLVTLVLFFSTVEVAQDPPRLAFDVASVKLNKSSGPADSHFPLGPGNTYRTNGGRFWAVGFPVAMYVR